MVTGAIAPSSRALAELIVESAGVGRAEAVVELGPGTGVFTGQILQKLPVNARFVAIERNPAFSRSLRKKYPKLAVVDGCASRLQNLLQSNGIQRADAVVSGLPWAIFNETTQASILTEVRGAVGEAGTFATFAYFGPHWLAAGRSFRRLLERNFASVRISRTVLCNVPPAFVYICRAA